MNIPRPSFRAGGFEPSLLLAFQLERLEAVRMAEKEEPDMPEGKPENAPDKQDKGPTKPAPEIIPPRKDGDMPDVAPEMPEMPQKPEIGPSQGPDVVEMPEMPSTPETGVPARDLPGGILH